MSDYPDPEEEYELMYADELEMLNEDEEHNGKVANNVLRTTKSINTGWFR